MCGRYVRRSDKQEIATRFRLGKLPEGFVLPPDFNIAPSTFQPVIRANKDTGEREIVMMRWGLQPNFAKSRTAFSAFATINARAETVASNRMWATPFQRRRCLVPADFYIEWALHAADAPIGATLKPSAGDDVVALQTQVGAVDLVPTKKRAAAPRARKPKPPKQPWAYSMTSGRPFAFGGLWDAWRDPALPADDPNAWLQSFAIITVEANELAARVHNRMPEIIYERDYDLWLDRSFGTTPDEQTQLLALLRPFDADLMQAHLANPAIGNVRNNGPEMLTPIPVSEDPNEPAGPDSA